MNRLQEQVIEIVCQYEPGLLPGSFISNFLRRLALPKSINDWSLRTMREKLVKIGAKVVSHARYVTFQMAEVLVSKSLFYEILAKINRLKAVPNGYD